MIKCCVFAVTGMGGMGKTTLAQKIYNDKKIQSEFDIKVWVCVSQNYNEIKLLQQVIRGAGGSYGEGRTKAELEPLLQSAVNGKSLFLVLDDVWRADVWSSLFRNPLQSADANNVRILVTTRDENVVGGMRADYTHRVNQLSEQTSWEMLCRKVFKEGEKNEIGKLKDIGMQIIKKCFGLPLAIKAIAGVLANKGTNRKEWEKILKNDAWSMSNRHEELPGALYLSYDDLPSPLKQCFVYCSLFPEDASLHRDVLVQLWVAEGFVKEQHDSLMEDVAEEYYNELIRRNILQPDPDFLTTPVCKMHDFLRSLAKFLSRDEIFSGNDMAATTTSLSSKLRRLSIENQENIPGIRDLIVEQKSLRTLLAFNAVKLKLDDDLFVGLKRLRVLKINNNAAEFFGPNDIERFSISISDSIGDLIHLRYLNLDFTYIKELPESIGSLINLEYLHLRGCVYLKTLTKSITKLQNLRCLDLSETLLTSMPQGISKLKKINDHEGFVVADPSEPEGSYSSVEELNSLYELRKLSISKFERAQKGAVSLQKLTRLVQLKLFYTNAIELQEEITRIEAVLEELCPPQCLERLEIFNFFGNRHPSWMQSPSFGKCLPRLTRLRLVNNNSCPQLPPAGELPQLSHLYIGGAAAVKSIGPEFLGVGVLDDTHTTTTTTAFPNIKILHLNYMLELEEWTLNREVEGFEQGRSGGQTQAFSGFQVLPHLDELLIKCCPKLKALPKSLEQSKMKNLHIEEAYSLRAVENLPNVMQELKIINNKSLERVSHLPALQVLVAKKCPLLNCVEKLDSLKRLELDDFSMVGLPEWLPRLLEERKPTDDDDFLFQFICSNKALRRLLKGGPDWSIIERIPQVFASEYRGSGFLRYTRNPFNYDTNLEM